MFSHLAVLVSKNIPQFSTDSPVKNILAMFLLRRYVLAGDIKASSKKYDTILDIEEEEAKQQKMFLWQQQQPKRVVDHRLPLLIQPCHNLA